MKYAWIEEMVDGEEILDGEGLPFDPPQYEQVGTGNGIVVGLNRKGQDDEQTGNCSPQELVWGMDTELYHVVSLAFTPFTQEEADAVFVSRDSEKAKEDALAQADKDFMEAESLPVPVDIGGTIYYFKAGYESSQMIDSARTLADNLNENDVELWDFYDEPHIFSKSEANDIAIAVGLSFRTNYSVMKHTKKDINDGV